MGVPAGRHPARRPVGFWCPGLRPGTRCKARATTTAKAAAGIPDLAGRCGLAGHAVNPSLGARWRLARVRCPAHTARPGLGVLPNPPEACLGPMAPTVLQAHTAPPLTDFRDRVDPRHAWMNLHRDRICRIEIENHPRMAWIYCRSQNSVEGGVVSECGVSAAWMRLPSLQGRTCGVPALRHRPAIPRETSFCFGCCCCSGLQQVQGCKPCNKPYLPMTLAIASTSSSPVTGLRRKPPMPAASTCC